MHDTSRLLKTTPAELTTKVTQLLHNYKQSEKDIIALQQKLVMLNTKDLLSEVKILHGVQVLFKQLNNVDMPALRLTLDQLRTNLDKAVIVLFSVQNAHLNVVAGVSASLHGQVPDAVQLVRHMCDKGGGRADMAQGGSSLPKNLAERIASLEKLL